MSVVQFDCLFAPPPAMRSLRGESAQGIPVYHQRVEECAGSVDPRAPASPGVAQKNLANVNLARGLETKHRAHESKPKYRRKPGPPPARSAKNQSARRVGFPGAVEHQDYLNGGYLVMELPRILEGYSPSHAAFRNCLHLPAPSATNSVRRRKAGLSGVISSFDVRSCPMV